MQEFSSSPFALFNYFFVFHLPTPPPKLHFSSGASQRVCPQGVYHPKIRARWPLLTLTFENKTPHFWWVTILRAINQ